MKSDNSIFNYKIKYRTSNISAFINNCILKNLKLSKLKKLDNNTIEFFINERDLKALKSCEFYMIENASVVMAGGKNRIVNFLKFRIGLLVGFIVLISMLLFLQNKLFYIKIIGNYNISKNDIIKSVNDYGIKYMTYINKDMTLLQEYLTKTHNLSLVSIVSKGNVLIINIKEELPSIDSEYEQIIAEENMVIKSINVYAGTSRFKAGDLVKIGDVLVEPYYYENNEKIMIKPMAEIECYTYVSASEKYLKFHTEKVRTGKSEIVYSEFCLGDKILYKHNKINSYLDCEIETSESVISNYFLPLKIKKSVAYELTEINVENNFIADKDNVISRVKSDAYSKVDNSIDKGLIKEEISIVDVDNGFVVNCHLEIPKLYRYN